MGRDKRKRINSDLNLDISLLSAFIRSYLRLNPLSCRKKVEIGFDQLAQEIAQLLAPPGPIVVHVGAPEVEPVGDALRVEDIGEAPAVREADILPRSLATQMTIELRR